MGPKVNGNSMADLVKLSVNKEVETQLTEMHNLLLGNSGPRLPPHSTSSSQLCRHWLRRRCTWRDKCRFSHGSEASDADVSEVSAADVVDAKDLVEEELKCKEGGVTLQDEPRDQSTSVSSCEVKLNSSEVVGCLINSNLPTRPQPLSGVRPAPSTPAGPTLAHRTSCRVVSSGADLPSSRMASAASTTQSLQQLPPISKEELWQESMVEAVDNIEAKYKAKYDPAEHDGLIHSAKVAVPAIDFANQL